MSDDAPAVDFSKIKFPTDRLTVSDLRRLYPRSFDRMALLPSARPGVGPVYGRKSLEATIGGVLDGERLVAGLAFKAALGLQLTAEEGLETRSAIAELLASDYITAGLACGENHARQLIRGIESQALAQAAKTSGRSR